MIDRTNRGLKLVAKQAWYTKLRKQTADRFQAVLALTAVSPRGGTLRGVENPAFAVAVLKLYGYEADVLSGVDVVYVRQRD